MPSPSLLLTLVCSSPPKLPSSTAQKSVCSTPPILDSTVRHTLLSLCKQISWAAHADQIGSHAPLGPWRSGQASCHASLQLRRRRRAHPCGTRNHAQQGGAWLKCTACVGRSSATTPRASSLAAAHPPSSARASSRPPSPAYPAPSPPRPSCRRSQAALQLVGGLELPSTDEECGCERAAGSVTSAARGGSPLCES